MTAQTPGTGDTKHDSGIWVRSELLHFVDDMLINEITKLGYVSFV